MPTTVNQTQRLLISAIDSLSELEARLRERMSVPDVVSQVDQLITTLQDLVGKASTGDRTAVTDYSSAKEALSNESDVRGQGQEGRLCAS